MQAETALQLIEAAFGGALGYSDQGIGDQWVDILDALQENNIASFRGNLPVHKFVYFGASHFDRWVAPSPFVVMPGSLQRFERFLAALIELEGPGSRNCWQLRLHQLRNVIFARHAHVHDQPGTQAQPDALRRYLTELNRVPVPLDPELRAAFEADYEELKHIIDGIADQSLSTVIVTSLPYALCLRPMKINTS